ncbi:MAG: ABC transporter substrate-binding protein [Planctomycetota bacterium]|jgi:NitT/TauT family transport system substrate-binding protein
MNLNPPNRRSFATGLPWLALLATMLVGCGGSGSPTDSDGARRVTVQLNWFPEPEFGGFYAAKERGIFEQAGFDVELIKGGADVPAPQLVASGNVDFAVVSAPQLVTIRARGGRATGVFASFQISPRSLLVKRESPYQSLQELWESDATIMAQDGLVFIRWLNSIYDGSKLSFIPYAGSTALFVDGKAESMQCFATAEPVQLEVDGLMTRVFVVGETGYNPYDGVLAVNDGLLEAEPEMVARFVEAVRQGWASYLTDPDPINDVISKLNPDLKSNVLRLAAAKLPAFVRSADTAAHGLGWMTADRWGDLVKQLETLGEITADDAAKLGRIHVNPVIDPAPVN